MPSSEGLVLVTGGTGFLGTETIRQFLVAGYSVRATARSPEKAQEWENWAFNKDIKGRVEWVIVKDQATSGAYDEAMKGVTYLAHTSSPFHYNANDLEKDMLIPALEGTKSALLAAHQAGVKQVVLTSSFAAVLDVTKAYRPGYTYTEEDWNPADWKSAAKKGQNQAYTYCASKSIAERWAWDYVKSGEAKYSLTALCPCEIFGPASQVIKSMDSLNTSSADIYTLIDGSKEQIPETGFPVGVDVRDVARAHVLAIQHETAKNQRYLLIPWHFFFEQVAEVVKKTIPDKASLVRHSDRKVPIDHYETDSTKIEKDLGIRFIGFEQCMGDTANRLFEIEELVKGKSH